MTSKKLCSEKRILGLMKEDIKRRIWGLALMLLAFFFALPVKLALVMENAQRMEFRAYNGYQPVEGLLPKNFTKEQYDALITFFKTEVVLDEISYGNGFMVFLLLTAAVIAGVTGFSYLHNKKKVDFYHSIPIRRELLFAVQYADGILIPAAAYLSGCILFAAVARAYGVPVSEYLAAMAVSLGMNLLYYSLAYGIVTVAMMMTGNMVIGVLGIAVLFGFFPLAAGLSGAFADVFFVTSLDSFPYLWAVRNLSPAGAYIWSAVQAGEAEGIQIGEVLKASFSLLAVTAVSLELYRLRPSEAAGKAMAFSKSKAPVRILLVLLGGMAGGLFFWTLQSQVKWGLFGTAAGVILVHCVIEIIYHFDFKKLFSHKIQMVLCLAAGMMFFCSFRYDWYGYDSYVPEKEEIVSVSADISMDHRFHDVIPMIVWDKGVQKLKYKSTGDFIIENMKITDLDPVLELAQGCCEEAMNDREAMLSRWETSLHINAASVYEVSEKDAAAISVIGGADGPTSVFTAFKQEGEKPDRYSSVVRIYYTLKNGRRISRQYNVDLESVLDAYETLYNDETYKRGLYSVLSEEPEEIGYLSYCEGSGPSVFKTTDKETIKKFLEAYQADLLEQTLKDRMKEDPVGTLQFADREVCLYGMKIQNGRADFLTGGIRRNVQEILGLTEPPVHQDEMPSADEMEQFLETYMDMSMAWPLYPSFSRTMELLRGQQLQPGAYFSAENAAEISVDVSAVVTGDDGLPKGERLERIRKANPFYREEGTLVFTEPEQIRLLMTALRDCECARMNGMRQPEEPMGYYPACEILLKDAGPGHVQAEFWPDGITPEIEAFFKGLDS